MKRLLIFTLILALMLTAVSCGNNNETSESPEDSTESTAAIEPGENKTALTHGVYTATSAFSSGEMNMVWNFVLTLNEDGTFTVANDAGEEKGAGTYALTDSYYTMTYSDARTCTFFVQEDGTLKMTSDFPYGMATIQLALVGDIVFTYAGTGSEGGEEGGEEGSENGDVYTLNAGAYAGTYIKESAMAGTVEYKYEAAIGEDGTFSYSTSFAMGETTMNGSSANGTYTVNGNVFTFTDSEGNVIEGTLTADNTLQISLKASQMASTPYEVTLTYVEKTVMAFEFAFEAGTYTATYVKESPMAGTVEYKYEAIVGEDGTFSYSVSFAMGGTTMSGASAAGTYVLDNNVFTFTDSEGNVTVGTLVGDNAICIELKASQMATEPYEITLTIAE